MKNLLILAGLFCSSISAFSQVGIGTMTPNSKSLLDLSATNKGFLLPRMTSSQRTAFVPNNFANEIGMMVYQTDSPKGVYSYNGSGWNYHAPIESGGANGHTLRWDGSKWITTSNLFNQGTTIGIGTSNPNNMLQIHTTAIPNTRIQLTNAFTEALLGDGLLLGIGNTTSSAPGVAHLIQQEEKALWFGTNAFERMRIDSAGNVGINTSTPDVTLDVNGTIRLGEHGSILHGIMRDEIEIDPPMIDSMTEWSITEPFPNATENAVVYVSPATDREGLAICYARVSAPGMVTVKIMNVGDDIDWLPFTLQVAVIQ